MWTMTILAARRRVSRVIRYLCILGTMEGPRHVSPLLYSAMKVMLVFSLVASLGKDVFRIQNPFLIVVYDCSIGNDIAVVYWRSGEK